MKLITAETYLQTTNCEFLLYFSGIANRSEHRKTTHVAGLFHIVIRFLNYTDFVY